MLNLTCIGTGVAVLALGLAGCVDAKGKFQQFNDRVGTDDGGVECGPGVLADISGTFLLASDPAFVPGSDTAQLFQFLATSTYTPSGDGAVLRLSMQPLRLSGQPYREGVGEPLVADNVPVSRDGNFTATFTGIIPGPANPLTGTDTQITATICATIKSADLFCGPLGGSSSGIDFAGSTFAAIRTESTQPQQLPPPQPSCTGTTETDAGMVDAGTDAPVDAPTDLL